MLKHDDLDTIISNLHELLTMIEHRSGDMYIASMKQYIVNPMAWVLTEKMIRALKSEELAATVRPEAGPANTQRDAIKCCHNCGYFNTNCSHVGEHRSGCGEWVSTF